MKHRRLANTGIYVSELCLGAMTFGGVGPFQAIGALGQDRGRTALVHRSLDAGDQLLRHGQRLLGRPVRGDARQGTWRSAS